MRVSSNGSENPRYKENPIMKLTFEFSLSIIKYTEELEKIRRFNVANQLFRSGTSIGSNIREAQNAESRADFIHKMKIALKEADETEYWLLLCEEAESYPKTNKLREELRTINKVLNKIIASAKNSKTKE